jgi:uncharacterized protein (TIGR03083 family)
LTDGLSEEALSQPSACTEWQVRDVVAHLVAAAENWGNIIAGALEGDPPSALGWRSTLPQPDENAQTAIELSKALQDRLVPTFLGHIDRVDRLLTQITDKDWETLVFHNADGVMPLRLYINSVSRGVGVHGWDLRGGVDKAAELGPDCVPALVDSIEIWLRRGFSFNPNAALPNPVRFRFNLTGAVSGTRDVVVCGDDFTVEVDGTSQSDIVYHCDAGDFVLMAYGRLSSHEAQLQGRLNIEGDENLAAQFDAWFNNG